jgi:hypothetical protein
MSEDNITTEYLKYQEFYNKKYVKDRSLVLMQVGKFYEAYQTEDRGFDLKKLEEITDAVCSRRNKKIEQISIKNPKMWGFPCEEPTRSKYFIRSS